MNALSMKIMKREDIDHGTGNRADITTSSDSSQLANPDVAKFPEELKLLFLFLAYTNGYAVFMGLLIFWVGS